jgi:tetratricopeptide (TPR) repeat protein
MGSLADVYHGQGRRDEGESLALQRLEIAKRVFGVAHPDTLSFMSHLARMYRQGANYDGAEPLRLFMRDLATVDDNQSNDDEAEPLYLEVLGIVQRVLGEEHPDTLTLKQSLAWMFRTEGRYDEAEPLYLRVLELRRRVLGEEHRDTMMSMRGVAFLHSLEGRYNEAESLYLELIEMSKRVLGVEHLETLVYMHDLAFVYTDQGRYDKAERLYLETLGIARRALGEAQFVLAIMQQLAVMYGHQGRYDEAESLLLQMLELSKRKMDMVDAMSLLAWLHEVCGRFDLALEIRRELAERPGASYWDLNDYAWLLLTAEPETLRDPQAALGIALRANEMSGYRWSTQLYTLALAYHLTGDTTKSIEIEQLALDLLPDYANDRYLQLRRPLAYFQDALERETGR